METDLRVAHNREFAVPAAEVDILGADIDARTTSGANLMINFWRHFSLHSGNTVSRATGYRFTGEHPAIPQRACHQSS